MGNIFFQSSAILHMVVLTIIYLTKTKEKTIENYIFRNIIISIIATVFIDMIGILVGLYFDSKMLNEIIGKFYLCGIISWIMIYTFYIYVITHEKNEGHNLVEGNENTIFFKKQKKKILIINIIVIILIFLAPLFANINYPNYYTYGPSAMFGYTIGGICLITWVILMIKNQKKVKKEQARLIILTIVISVSTFIFQILNPEFLLISPSAAFVTTLAYFMIENPDLQYIEELNIATRQALAANHAKSDFLSSMSHEIRTPLNAIVGFSQALAKEDISGTAKDEVKDIINASNELLETVNGILDVSKIEAKKIDLLPVDYSTKKLINEVINSANSRLGSKQIELKFDIDKNLPPVLYGDNVRIKQIILNLLSNAIKYTKEGYIKFKIQSQSSNNKCLLTITIEDTGIGMTKEDLDMLFVKFQRFEMDKNVNISGTGLGMAITKGLVELMNGAINVDSEYHKGTTFTIVLEQNISSKPIEEVATAVELQRIKPFNAFGQRILVVDDNKINLKVAEKLLSDYQVSMDFVESGRECINKIISGEKYDLILLDIMMPKMYGPEVLKNLKAQAGFNTPVIALTADVISGMEEKYTTQGFDDCLPKPIVEEELFYLLKKYLKEYTPEGLSEDNYQTIESPTMVNSPVVKKIITPEIEEFELPALAKKENINVTENKKIDIISKIEQNKNNLKEYTNIINQIKEIADKENLAELSQIAYEQKIACEADYQEFIELNQEKFINEIKNHIDIIEKSINIE